MAVPGTPDERLAYVNPSFVSDLHYYETGSAEAIPETSAPTAAATAAIADSDTNNNKSPSSKPVTEIAATPAATALPVKPTLSSAVVAAAILEKQTSFKELSEKLSSAAVSGQPGAGSSLKGKSTKGSESAEEGKPVAPDGGCLAWAIVTASFMVSFLQDGFSNSFGIILPSVSEHFNTGRTEAAMTSSIMTFLTLGSGPLVAFLVQRFGHRWITLIGVVLSSLGLLVAGMSIEYMEPPSLAVLYLSIGLMTGLGFGLMYLPAIDIIEVYFDRNLGLATGIAAAGSGVGQLALAPIIQILEEKIGLGKTIFVLSAAIFSAIGFALMYKMPKRPVKVEKRTLAKSTSLLGFPTVEYKTNDKTEKDVQVQNSKANDLEKQTIQKSLDRSSEQRRCLDSDKYFGWFFKLMKSYGRIFRSPAMVTLLASHFLFNIAINAAFAFTADRAILLGITRQDTSFLLSIMGISNCCGRIIFGKILDAFRPQAFISTTIVLLSNATIIIVSDFLTTYVGQAVYCAIFGATFGAYISSLIVIVKTINKENVTDCLGVCLLVIAMASMVGPAIVGHIYDIYGSYLTGFLVVGSLAVLGALLMPVVYLLLPKSNVRTSSS